MSSARAGGGPFRAFTLGVGKHRCPLAAWMGRCPALVTGVCGSAWRQLCHRRCVTYSSLSHVRGKRLPSEEFHHHVWHGRLRLSQGSGAGALGSGFHGISGFRCVECSWLFRAGRAHAGVAGLRKGLVPHALYPSPPDAIVPRLGVYVDRFFGNCTPSCHSHKQPLRATPVFPWSRAGHGNMKFEFGGSLFSEDEAFVG